MNATLNILKTPSQADPGFRFMAVKALVIYLLVAAFIALFFAFSGPVGSSSSALFTPPKAFAAMNGMAAGSEGARAYTQSEERYIIRAVSGNPDNLIKLDGHGVRVVLDEPEMVRADLPSVLWQYRTERCVLDVYFKSKSRNADNAPVVYYETRARNENDKISREECLADFMPHSYGPRMVSVSTFYKSYIR